MDLPGPESQDLTAPPVFQAQIQKSFLGPSPQLVDQCGFATAGWTGNDNLPKTLPFRKRDTLDHLQVFNFNRFQRINPVMSFIYSNRQLLREYDTI